MTVKLSEALAAEYRRLFDECRIRPERQAAVDATVDKLIANRGRYEAAVEGLGIPWAFVAVIHNMESSLNFSRHLHNGDSLKRRTVRVPKGRPSEGSPPFTWEESAHDALTFKGLDDWHDWSLAGTLYQIERYNGWGYRKYHPDVLSPYLWSGSQLYSAGKYVADGRWSDSAVSQQLGAAVLLRRLEEREAGSAMATAAGAGAEAEAVPAVAAKPKGPAGPLVVWGPEAYDDKALLLQQGLNRFPGVFLREDGLAGRHTSDAAFRVLGAYLQGDPDHPA
ncbi:hypothetical protein GCM10011348_23600 [Marinobacterium nitratireducens]|uniref:Lysozyme family protein n=1 Tax=Marinobacterium nitratireducens TaxID=518897 RepID=A0A917ZHS5_9GAMM|nr:hypothetical protein [Marinobacterium nitratireducens]GGO82369.1 hypothetical protein GCM10011348_23600 [Marinobacterium nitratireducens]